MSVEEIGDHFISLAPGGRSLVTAGIWLLIKTSHCNRLVIGSSSRRSRILFYDLFRARGLAFGHPNCCQLNLPPRTKGLPLSRDRKSTRLNSSHRCISYAVFCLKKKKNEEY